MWDSKYKDGIWLVDFEFHPLNNHEGNHPVPVCMVAQEMKSGIQVKVWKNELESMNVAPFQTGIDALFVAFYASAEIGCFIQLGWPLPENVLDLYSEFRCLTNGRPTIAGNNLIGALSHFGLDAMESFEKKSKIQLILTGGPWTTEEKKGIINYCESDVISLARLYPIIEPYIDWPRALLRGQYSISAAIIESNGIPIDLFSYKNLEERWDDIKLILVKELDLNYGVYEGLSFKTKLFENYLIKHNIAWPRLISGRLDLSEEVFKEMAISNPSLQALHELRNSLSKLKLSELQVGEDGRNRCLLSILKSTTGRNQPSTSKYIFGPAVWLRGLIKPKPGHAVAYIDWSQQEFGIAAALSNDPIMMQAYRSGDPYLSFAKEAGAVPISATKKSHSFEREQFKACVLAVQYGMGPEALSLKINQPIARARQLLSLHRRTFKVFWNWIEGVLNHALLTGHLMTVFGWRVSTPDIPNARSLCNFPMQANGAEMLRIACMALTQRGITVCATVHDAILIEAEIGKIDETVEMTRTIMRNASNEVLGGFELESETQVIRYPDRYMDKRGTQFWNLVMKQIDQSDQIILNN
jgi:hypothetical protein